MFAAMSLSRPSFRAVRSALAVQHAAGIAASGKVPVLRLTLPGFDTHQNQLRFTRIC